MRIWKIKTRLILSLWILLLLSSPLFAMERFDILTTNQVKQLLDDRAAGKTDFILVNTLDEIIFKHSSIPGSINIPWSRVNELIYKLGEDKNKLIITY